MLQRLPRLCAIPLDSRPVCYDFPQQVAQAAGLELCMPAPNLLSGRHGDLKAPANDAALRRWLKTYLHETSAVLVGLDTLAYGGLIPSRLGDEPIDEVQARLDSFFQMVVGRPVYGFSSILRIPNYNNDEEEPRYWASYGADLYAYSAALHRDGRVPEDIVGRIPEGVLVDFHRRRERNFSINQQLFQRLIDGQLQALVYAQDDTGPYGLNVQEAEVLQQMATEQGLADRAWVKTGADEVLLTLLVRWTYRVHPVSASPQPLSIFPVYTHPQTRLAMARYDGLTIESLVHQQIQACGAVVAPAQSGADLVLWVHTPPVPASGDVAGAQLDHCQWPGQTFGQKPADYRPLLDDLTWRVTSGQKVMVADLAYANGGDPALVDAMMTANLSLTTLYGYAGWNTPGNALGSVLALGLMRYWAEHHETFRPHSFSKALLARLADDGLYQGQVRQEMKQAFGTQNGQLPDEAHLNARMADGLALLKSHLALPQVSVHCQWPCHRWFEVGLQIAD
jgi:hypothetical protein